MNEKPTYRFEIKAKRTGKKIKHYMNKDDYGFFGKDVSKATDERMKNIALGIVIANWTNGEEVYVEVYKLNEQGGYDLIRTQF